MTYIADTPGPPYYAVIFTSTRSDQDEPGYVDAAERMFAKAALQPGYLGIELQHSDAGVTICYWESLEAIAAWRNDAEHAEVPAQSKLSWYSDCRVRIASVERDYGKR